MIEPSFEPSQPLGIIKGLRVRMIEACINKGKCMHKNEASHFVAQMKKLMCIIVCIGSKNAFIDH